MGFKTRARQFFYCILCGSMVEYSPIVLTYIMLHVCLIMVILSEAIGRILKRYRLVIYSIIRGKL